jgi:hypothetical protein
MLFALCLFVFAAVAGGSSSCVQNSEFSVGGPGFAFKIGRDAVYVLLNQSMSLYNPSSGKVIGSFGNKSVFDFAFDFAIDEANNQIALLTSAINISWAVVFVYELNPLSASPKLLFTFGNWSLLPTNGSFASPTAIIIDQHTGDMIIGDEKLDNVQRFDKNGNFLNLIGGDWLYGDPQAFHVDAVGALVLDIQEFSIIRTFNNNAPSQQIALNGHYFYTSMAVDIKGRLFLSASSIANGTAVILVLSKSAVPLFSFGQSVFTSTGGSSNVDQLHFDQAEYLYALDSNIHIMRRFKCT